MALATVALSTPRRAVMNSSSVIGETPASRRSGPSGTQEAAGPGFRGLAVLSEQLAVDDRRVVAHRSLLEPRCPARDVVDNARYLGCHGVGVEDGDVGRVAGRQ